MRKLFIKSFSQYQSTVQKSNEFNYDFHSIALKFFNLFHCSYSTRLYIYIIRLLIIFCESHYEVIKKLTVIRKNSFHYVSSEEIEMFRYSNFITKTKYLVHICCQW